MWPDDIAAWNLAVGATLKCLAMGERDPVPESRRKEFNYVLKAALRATRRCERHDEAFGCALAAAGAALAVSHASPSEAVLAATAAPSPRAVVEPWAGEPAPAAVLHAPSVVQRGGFDSLGPLLAGVVTLVFVSASVFTPLNALDGATLGG